MAEDGKSPSSALILGLGLGGLILHLLQWELLPFVLAAIIAFLTEPVIALIERRTHAPRWAATAGLFILIFALLGLLAFLSLREGAQASLNIAKGGLEPLRGELSKILGPGGVEIFGTKLTPDAVIGGLSADVRKIADLSGLGMLARPAAGGLVGLTLLVFATFYAMLSGPDLVEGGLQLLPGGVGARARQLQPELVHILRRYFTGILVIVVLTAAAAFVGYGLLFRVKHPFVLSLALGLLETVPVIGPLIAAALVLLAALQLHNLIVMVAMAAYAAALRLLVDDLVAPIVLGRSVSAHPLIVMLAYVVGAALFGVVGLLLSVPAIALVRLEVKTPRPPADPAGAAPARPLG